MRKTVLTKKQKQGFSPCSIKTFDLQINQLNQTQFIQAEKSKIQGPLRQLKSINQQDVLMPQTQNNSFEEFVQPIYLDDMDKLRGGNSRAFLLQTRENIMQSVSFEKKLKQQTSSLFINCEKEVEEEIEHKQNQNLRNFQLFDVFSNMIGEQLNDSNEI